MNKRSVDERARGYCRLFSTIHRVAATKRQLFTSESEPVSLLSGSRYIHWRKRFSMKLEKERHPDHIAVRPYVFETVKRITARARGNIFAVQISTADFHQL